MKRKLKSKHEHELTDHQKLRLHNKNRYNLAVHLLVILFFSVSGAYILQHFIFASTSDCNGTSVICVPDTIPQCDQDTATTDEGPALSEWLSEVPSTAANPITVEFPNNGCYYTQTVVQINPISYEKNRGPNYSNLTIDGNGTQFLRTFGNDKNQTGNNWDPYMEVIQNTNIDINGLVINGAYNDKTNGSLNEAHTGVYLESNNGATLNNMKFNNIEGDCLSLQPPDGDLTTPGYDYPYNVNITVTNSTFYQCGYDGVSGESFCGADISNDTWTDVHENAIDFEVDDYGTTLHQLGPHQQPVPCEENGYAPDGFVQDNITFSYDTFNNFNGDLFVSKQGAMQEQNVTLTHNQITGGGDSGFDGLRINVNHPALSSLPQTNWFDGLTITDNVSTVASRATFSASPGGSKPAGSPIFIDNAADVNISGNTAPVDDGTPNYQANTPYLAAVAASDVDTIIVQNNNFTGAYDVVCDTSSYWCLNSSTTGDNGGPVPECGNTYWVGGSKHDNSSCGVTTTPNPSSPAGVKAIATSSTSAKLTWDASSDTGGPGLGGYNIYRNGTKITSVGASTTSYADSTLAPSTTYTYGVQAFDSDNPAHVSARTNAASITTPNSSGTGGSSGGGSGGSSSGGGSAPIAVQKSVTAVAGNKSTTVCLPSGVNPDSVSSTTFSINGKVVGMAGSGSDCAVVSTAGLAPGQHTVTITLHDKNGSTQTYSESLVVKKLSWFRRYLFWIILGIILVFLGLFDAIWWAIHPKAHLFFHFNLSFLHRNHPKGPPGNFQPPTVIHPTIS